MKIDLNKITLKIVYGYYDEVSLDLKYDGRYINDISWETTVAAIIEMVKADLKRQREFTKKQKKLKKMGK